MSFSSNYKEANNIDRPVCGGTQLSTQLCGVESVKALLVVSFLKCGISRSQPVIAPLSETASIKMNNREHPDSAPHYVL